MENPRAVLFDAYGTLFDVYSVSLLAEQLFPSQGEAIAVLWRDKKIEYTRLVTTSNHGAHYQPFWALTRQAPARRDWPGLALLAIGIGALLASCGHRHLLGCVSVATTSRGN